MIEDNRYKTKRGVFLDVFPLDGVGETIEESAALFEKIDRLNMMHAARVCCWRKGRSWYKNLAVALCRLVPKNVLNPAKLSRQIEELCIQNSYDTSAFVANVSGGYHLKDVMPKEIFGTPKPVCFEAATVLIPEKEDEYLYRLYGEWKMLPPVKERVSRHEYAFLDLANGYREFSETTEG